MGVFNPPGALPPAMAGLYPSPAPVQQLGLTWPRPFSAQGITKDGFQRVGEGSIQPRKDDASYSIPVEIDAKGAIIQKTLAGPEVVGQLDTQGNFALADGQTGNLFRDGTLAVTYQYSDNPFMAALRDAELQRGAAGSEVPIIRQQLTQYGIDGRGVKVGILDAYENVGEGGNKTEQQPGWQVHDHSYAVGSIINSREWGVAPGSLVFDAGFRMPEEPETDRDNLALYMDNKLKGYTQIYDHTARQLQNIMQQADPSLRVLSLTWGSSRAKMYMDALVELNEKDDKGDYKRPLIRDAILGYTKYGSIDDKIQAVINFVDTLCNSPAMQQAHQRYIETTRQLAARGITLCVAAGNDHGILDSTAQYPPGAEFNDLAKSPYVIAVAASDTNQTPGDRRDDKLAAFSSWGDGNPWNPTVAAPGQEILINRRYGSIGRNRVINGTSYATPYTAGVVSMLIQANPSLIFDQIRSVLQTSATPIASSNMEAGAGALNPEVAVALASRMAAGAFLAPQAQAPVNQFMTPQPGFQPWMAPQSNLRPSPAIN